MRNRVARTVSTPAVGNGGKPIEQRLFRDPLPGRGGGGGVLPTVGSESEGERRERESDDCDMSIRIKFVAVDKNKKPVNSEQLSDRRRGDLFLRI